MKNNQKDISYFVAFCVEQYKNAKHINGKDAMTVLDSYGVLDYDVVDGPVANDKVYAAFALYEGGLLDRQSLIAELKACKLVDQYLFHTEKALKTIKFIDAKTIRL